MENWLERFFKQLCVDLFRISKKYNNHTCGLFISIQNHNDEIPKNQNVGGGNNLGKI